MEIAVTAKTDSERVCAGCGNDLGGKNLCMVSACQMEDEPGWCAEHGVFLCADHPWSEGPDDTDT